MVLGLNTSVQIIINKKPSNCSAEELKIRAPLRRKVNHLVNFLRTQFYADLIKISPQKGKQNVIVYDIILNNTPLNFKSQRNLEKKGKTTA